VGSTGLTGTSGPQGDALGWFVPPFQAEDAPHLLTTHHSPLTTLMRAIMSADGTTTPTLSVVVPAWNEAANLPACVNRLHTTFAGLAYEVVIVDDGSSDETLAVARRLAAEHPDAVRVETHAANQGLGAALRTGFAGARG